MSSRELVLPLCLASPAPRLARYPPGKPQFGVLLAMSPDPLPRRSPPSAEAPKRGLLGANETSIRANRSGCVPRRQDVSNALVSRQKFELIRDEQAQAVQATKSPCVAGKAGKASYFEVLDSQLQLNPAENALAVTELNRRAVIVQLYKALGGGWNLKDPEWMGPRS